MLGKVKFATGEATLTEDGKWESDNPDAVRVLTALAADYSPADGAFGLRMLEDGAEILGGEVTQAYEPAPLPEGALP